MTGKTRFREEKALREFLGAKKEPKAVIWSSRAQICNRRQRIYAEMPTVSFERRERGGKGESGQDCSSPIHSCQAHISISKQYQPAVIACQTTGKQKTSIKEKRERERERDESTLAAAVIYFACSVRSASWHHPARGSVRCIFGNTLTAATAESAAQNLRFSISKPHLFFLSTSFLSSSSTAIAHHLHHPPALLCPSIGKLSLSTVSLLYPFSLFRSRLYPSS